MAFEIKKLSDRDKRAIRIGILCAVGVMVLSFLITWLNHWMEIRKSLSSVRTELQSMAVDKNKQPGTLSIVPKFEMPQGEEMQKFLFRDKINEQLSKAGIRTEPMADVAASKSRNENGYRLLSLKCRGKGNIGQVFDLLAALKDNPYLAGIEEFKIKCGEKNRDEVELEMTLSTFVK